MRGSYDVQLLAYAMKALEDAQASIIPLERQIQDAERSKRKAAAELELARMAQTRFDAFGQERDRICPACYIEREIRSPLEGIGDHRFKCVTCESVFDL
jgi:predicted  nucleic acid-binding Zn ribbon protein